MATDAEKLAILNANQRLAARQGVASARKAAANLGTLSSAYISGGTGMDYSALPGTQNPLLTDTTNVLRRNITGSALGYQNALQRLIAMRKSKAYQGELTSGGLSGYGGVPALYNPTGGSSTVPVSAA